MVSIILPQTKSPSIRGGIRHSKKTRMNSKKITMSFNKVIIFLLSKVTTQFVASLSRKKLEALFNHNSFNSQSQ
ncbi:hypothetical protein QUH41_26680, partial [Klebsiella grimontii]|uniref:hypothetical protein n=1 Tax=Klebsiella grimontii TaxID=2058152 RepID=UPI0025A0BA17